MPKISIDLSGQWQFMQYPLSARKMADLETGDWLDTPVPSSIYTSLINAGKIAQKDLESNPEDFASISDKPWIYKKIFDCPPELLECDKIEMIFQGLDTITSIWLNEKLITRTNNMFIAHTIDVAKLLVEKDNRLMIKFEPPIDYAKIFPAGKKTPS